MKLRILALSLIVSTAACTVGPRYQRPDVPVPPAFRGATVENPSLESLGDLNWWILFQDEQLQRFIRTALAENLNAQIAATRIEQARAQVGIARGEQFPRIDGTGSAGRSRSPSNPVFPGFEANQSQLGLSSAWQLDFWGRYRKATEAARAELAASEWGRRAIVSTLVADVAGAYFRLLEFDLQLDIAKRTLESRRESLRLTQTLEKGGAITLLDVRSAEKLVETAAKRIPDLEKRMTQQENQLSILLGANPGPITRGQPLTSIQLTPTVPEGIPSSLLDRRPDIRQAEMQLVAANARIGVAKSMYFPQISLTGAAGFQAFSMTGLFDSKVFNVGTSMTAPIFDFGRIRSNVQLTEAQKEELVLGYRQTIQQAFGDVSDALIAVRKNREFRERQEALTVAASEASKLADLRYRGGASSYLEVLTSETDLFDAEIDLANAKLLERLSTVQLYSALGGGWQQ